MGGTMSMNERVAAGYLGVVERMLHRWLQRAPSTDAELVGFGRGIAAWDRAGLTLPSPDNLERRMTWGDYLDYCVERARMPDRSAADGSW